jgi:hypothetical protein
MNDTKVKGSLGGKPLLVKKLSVHEFKALQEQTAKGQASEDWLWLGYTPVSGGGGAPAHVYIYVAEEPDKEELPDIDTLTLAAQQNKGEW